MAVMHFQFAVRILIKGKRCAHLVAAHFTHSDASSHTYRLLSHPCSAAEDIPAPAAAVPHCHVTATLSERDQLAAT